MTAPIFPTLNGSALPLTAKVRDFWATVNWEGKLLVVPEPPSAKVIPPSERVSISLTLTLSVRQFFEAIAWDGIPLEVAEPTSAEDLLANLFGESTTASEDLTLDAFSDLFG